MNITSILNEFNESNSLNHKRNVCKKYKDNKLFIDVFTKTYDKVKWTWGITMNNIPEYTCNDTMKLETALLELERLNAREFTGNAAIIFLHNLLSNLSYNDASVIKMIINRDLRINFGKKEYNKIASKEHQCFLPTYMRCDTYSNKTAKNISFPAVVQLKADGTYREFNVQDGIVTARSRSGEEYEYPVIFEQMKDFEDGIYTGELTVRNITERSKGNGLINSDNPPHDDIVLELWDFISHAEYNKARLKDKKNPCETIYADRWDKLLEIVHVNKSFNNVKLIPIQCVNNLSEALEQTSKWMSEGFEGAILKDWSGVFKDGTSKQQLKLKLEISVEMRCTGFQEGTKGTKREGKVGSIVFSNDEGTIQGRCSGFTDDELDYFTAHQSELIGKIMEVQFNDLTKAEGNDYYALSHPRFIEWRNDKNETDTLEKAFQLRQMAMELK